MLEHIILLSGRIASGKSALAKQLVERHGAHLLKTNYLLNQYIERQEKSLSRAELQKLGESLDKKTNGRWVQEEFRREIDRLKDERKDVSICVVDAVRIQKQIDAFRTAYGNSVTHIHLDANDECLSNRYKERLSSIEELPNYSDLAKNKTERLVPRLKKFADVVVQTDQCSEEDVFIRVNAQLRIDQHSVEPCVDVLVGGQYGSEGKGNIAAYISPEYDFLVRAGGPNAGHKVYAEPEVRVFRHLPSGSEIANNAQILLTPGMVINPEVLLQEISDCGGIEAHRLSIDPKAVIIEQSDKDAEKELENSISSTGQGVGAATARKIIGRGITEAKVRTAADIKVLRPYVRPVAPILEKAYASGASILLEGTQGTTLSLHHGPYPYVTSRDTTVAGCLAEAGISPRRVRKIIMVCRTYPIRVGGNSGPLPKPISYEELSARSGIDVDELKTTEKTTTTNKQRRIAEFDWVQLKQSALLNAPTDIALTFADYLTKSNREARRFEQLSEETIRFIEEIEKVAKAPVSLISTRFKYRSVIDRRAW